MTRWDQRTAARDILSREVGCVRKPHGDRLRVALAFPNTYFVGMSNLGFQGVYRLFNDIDAVVCERVFLPPKQQLQDLLASGSRLVTLESQAAIGDFDLLAFSVSFEWDYTNLLTMLRMGRIPLRASERDARNPLVVVGGAITFLNPEPIAPFADVVAVGEGEVLIPRLVEACLGASDRSDLLGRLSRQRGFYVPSLVTVRYGDDGRVAGFEPAPGSGLTLPVRKAAVPSGAMPDPPSTTIFTPDTEFGSRLLIEVVRGCPNLCRFCWAGYNYLPVRPFPAAAILGRAQQARPHASEAGLVSIALCDHPEIDEILARLLEMGYRLSPASLRLDDLTESIVRQLVKGGERSITIAPETGSERLRRVLNKSFTNEQVLERADLAFSCGIESLKLYFMIGLPTEEDEDLVAIRDLVVALRERMLRHARRRGRIGRIAASVNPFVPKPGTAWQWLPLERSDLVDRKMKRLRALTAGLDNVFFSIKPERHSYYQALLSVGDRRVADVVERAEANGGKWREAAAEAHLDADTYVFRDRRADLVLPWEVIDTGMPATFLREELDRGFEGTLTEGRHRSRPSADPDSDPSR